MGELLRRFIGNNDRGFDEIIYGPAKAKNPDIGFNCIFSRMRRAFFLILVFFTEDILDAQQLQELIFDHSRPITVKEIKFDNRPIPVALPLFSIEVNNVKVNSNDGFFTLLSDHSLHLLQEPDQDFKDAFKIRLVLANKGISPVRISNIVPFGANEDHYYISGKTATDTTRSFLFQPGKEPLGVVVPHNNNDLNFTAVELGNGKTLFGLIKRDNDTIQNYLLNRTTYVLEPGKKIGFELYADLADGTWHSALKKCFQEQMLYEVKN
jgi:hypothetical protein